MPGIWLFRSAVIPATKTRQRAVKRMRSDLHRRGIHYFADAAEAGADYVSIERCACGKPREHDPVFNR